eukprot:4408079-Pyramimonas_sp.AAC.1
MAVRCSGSFVAGLLSTWTISLASPRTIISCAGAFGMLAAACSLFVKEHHSKSIDRHRCLADAKRPSRPSDQAKSTCAPWRAGVVPAELWVILPAAVFLMVYNSTPNDTAYESYIFTAFPGLTKAELSMRELLGQLGNLLGVLVFWRLFVHVGVRTSLVVTTTLSAVANLSRLIFTTESASRFTPGVLSALLGVDGFFTSVITRSAPAPTRTSPRSSMSSLRSSWGVAAVGK